MIIERPFKFNPFKAVIYQKDGWIVKPAFVFIDMRETPNEIIFLIDTQGGEFSVSKNLIESIKIINTWP